MARQAEGRLARRLSGRGIPRSHCSGFLVAMQGSTQLFLVCPSCRADAGLLCTAAVQGPTVREGAADTPLVVAPSLTVGTSPSGLQDNETPRPGCQPSLA